MEELRKIHNEYIQNLDTSLQDVAPENITKLIFEKHRELYQLKSSKYYKQNYQFTRWNIMKYFKSHYTISQHDLITDIEEAMGVKIYKTYNLLSWLYWMLGMNRYKVYVNNLLIGNVDVLISNTNYMMNPSCMLRSTLGFYLTNIMAQKIYYLYHQKMKNVIEKKMVKLIGSFVQHKIETKYQCESNGMSEISMYIAGLGEHSSETKNNYFKLMNTTKQLLQTNKCQHWSELLIFLDFPITAANLLTCTSINNLKL